eukprot:CAMPEP_0170794252 /NCGR_PEP_ID=MMETSP0733-20121128/23258_1 /TAXON_ID=186038 /ORGANISM="Fragilariopsis kerguelensis, Strain L26-C5" /LENGTH=109 /DNA_ID=CAMNT_0011143595 /DNA_START=231 /DNA_END=563 /DNA_ORIENTATION=-
MMISRHLYYAVLLLGFFLILVAGGVIENVEEEVAGGGGKLSWNGRSKEMFDNVVQGSPFFVRSTVESKMINEIKKRQLSVVTESDLYEVVRTVSPKLFLSKSLTAMGKA